MLWRVTAPTCTQAAVSPQPEAAVRQILRSGTEQPGKPWGSGLEIPTLWSVQLPLLPMELSMLGAPSPILVPSPSIASHGGMAQTGLPLVPVWITRFWLFPSSDRTFTSAALFPIPAPIRSRDWRSGTARSGWKSEADCPEEQSAP